MSARRRKATQEFPGTWNWKVASRRPAESVREQWRATVSTSVFRFFAFAVAGDMH